MPIEIRELNVRVSVTQNQQEQGKDQTAPVGGQPMPDKDNLISECVEQVMDILQHKEER